MEARTVRMITLIALPVVALLGFAPLAEASYSPVPGTCTVLVNTLGEGSRDSAVVRLQNFLIGRGYLSGYATGTFGRSTYTALTYFQADNGLQITGVADSPTRARIEALSCGSRYTEPQPTVRYVAPQPVVRYDYGSSRNSTYRYPTSRHTDYDEWDYSYSRKYDYEYDYGYSHSYNWNDYGRSSDQCYQRNGRWYGSCNSYRSQKDDYRYDSYGYGRDSHFDYYACQYDRACSGSRETYRF
jgi:hypothetical protein